MLCIDWLNSFLYFCVHSNILTSDLCCECLVAHVPSSLHPSVILHLHVAIPRICFFHPNKVLKQSSQSIHQEKKHFLAWGIYCTRGFNPSGTYFARHCAFLTQVRNNKEVKYSSRFCHLDISALETGLPVDEAVKSVEIRACKVLY